MVSEGKSTPAKQELKQELDRPGKIIVLGIPKLKAFSNGDLEKHFAKFGRITEINIIRDKKKDIPRGFAFITYENPQDSKDAIKAMEGFDLKGEQKVHCEEAVIGLKEHNRKDGSDVRGGRGGARGRGAERGSFQRGRGAERGSYQRGRGAERGSYQRGRGSERGTMRGRGGERGMMRGRGGDRGMMRGRGDSMRGGRGRIPALLDMNPRDHMHNDYGFEYEEQHDSYGYDSYAYEEPAPLDYIEDIAYGPPQRSGGSRGGVRPDRGAPRSRGYSGYGHEDSAHHMDDYAAEEFDRPRERPGLRRGIPGRGASRRGGEARASLLPIPAEQTEGEYYEEGYDYPAQGYDAPVERRRPTSDPYAAGYVEDQGYEADFYQEAPPVRGRGAAVSRRGDVDRRGRGAPLPRRHGEVARPPPRDDFYAGNGARSRQPLLDDVDHAPAPRDYGVEAYGRERARAPPTKELYGRGSGPLLHEPREGQPPARRDMGPPRGQMSREPQGYAEQDAYNTESYSGRSAYETDPYAVAEERRPAASDRYRDDGYSSQTRLPMREPAVAERPVRRGAGQDSYYDEYSSSGAGLSGGARRLESERVRQPDYGFYSNTESDVYASYPPSQPEPTVGRKRPAEAYPEAASRGRDYGDMRSRMPQREHPAAAPHKRERPDYGSMERRRDFY